MDASLEAADFIDGRAARGAGAAAGDRRGRSAASRRAAGAWAAPARSRWTWWSICCHGGPGEDGTLQARARPRRRRLHRARCGRAPPWAWTSWRSPAVAQAAGLPVLPRVLLDTATSTPSAFAGSLHPQAPFRRVVDRCRGRRRPRHRAGRLDANPHLRAGAVVEPYREDLFDLNVAVRTWPRLELSAVERPCGRRAAAEILGYADKYVGGRGDGQRPATAARRSCAAPGGGPPRRGAHRGAAGATSAAWPASTSSPTGSRCS